MLYATTAAFSDTPYNESIAGLEIRPTYQKMVDYIERDPDKAQYPNRKASVLRNSFETTQLEGIG